MDLGASWTCGPLLTPVVSETSAQVAVVTEDPASVPAVLRFLGIGYNAFGAGNLTGLDLSRYSVVVFDYAVGKPSEECVPRLDVSAWLQTTSEKLSLWLGSGGALIDYSEGENFVVDGLSVKRALSSSPLTGVLPDDSLLASPNSIGRNLSEQVSTAFYVVGGSELALYDFKANATDGPALLARSIGEGRVYLSTLPSDRSIVRRGLLENMLYEASNGEIMGSPYQIAETGTENLRIRFPYFAESMLVTQNDLQAAFLNLSALAGLGMKDLGKISIDFMRDLEWETGSAQAVSAGSTLFIDVWQLPELMGTESRLACTFNRGIGRMLLGWTGIMGASHVESMACLAEVYGLNLSDSQAGDDLIQQYTSDWQQLVSGNDSRTDLDASEMTGMFLSLVQEYGWNLIAGLCTRLDPVFDYSQIQWNNRLSLLIHYLSVSAGADLVPQFENWGFEVDPLGDIDRSPPSVTLVTPANPTTVFVNIPKFEAVLADDFLVNTSSILVFLNGIEITANCSVSPVHVVYCPTASLPEGENSLRISLSDVAGKACNWSLCFEATSRCSLVILSEYGTVTGAGVYRLGETAEFNVTSTIAPGSPGVRHVFTKWASDSPEGYNGYETSRKIVLNGNVTQIAEWKTQYLLTMTSGQGGVITPISGWFDSGDAVNITAKAQKGYEFVQWVGEGAASYTGVDANHTLIMQGPIGQRAAFWDIEPPVAKAGKNQTLELGKPVTLDASGSSDNVGIARYAWDLGDGSIGNMPFMTYTYAKTGVYRVSLTVSDGSGNSASDAITITVKEASQPPPDGPSLPSWVTTYGPWIALLAVAALLLGLMPFLITKATG